MTRLPPARRRRIGACPEGNSGQPTLDDLALLDRARAALSKDVIDRLAAAWTRDGSSDFGKLDLTGVAGMMDQAFALGFRDPLLPVVGPDYLDHLDSGRRALGIRSARFEAMLWRVARTHTLEALDMDGFLNVLFELGRRGHSTELPARTFMTRERMRLFALARSELGIAFVAEMDLLREVGGVFRAPDLDERGFRRVLAALASDGFKAPIDPPRVPRRAGFVTQAQANLIWRLWNDLGGVDGDRGVQALETWFKRSFAFPFGLHALTQAGARAVIDHLMVRMSTLREAKMRQAGRHSRAGRGPAVHGSSATGV